MLKELFDRVIDMGRADALPRVLHPEAEPEHIYYLCARGPDGTLTMTHRQADPEPREHIASDFSAIVQFARDHSADGNRPEIWCSRHGITCFLNPEERRDQVKLPFSYSPQITLLNNLELAGVKATGYDQKGFIQLLRITLGGAGGDALLRTVRAVKFRQAAEGEGQIGHGKSSIGKSLQAELTGVTPFPEEINLAIPVFQGCYCAFHDIMCALEIDPSAERFYLIPFPGQVEAAMRDAEAEIIRRVSEMISADPGCKGLDIAIFYGTP